MSKCPYYYMYTKENQIYSMSKMINCDLFYPLAGYIVEAGVTRQPYGGHRITEALNSSFTESKYRFFTDVEFQIVRMAMEKSCYVAEEYNAEMRKSQDNPRQYKKTIHLEQYGLPLGTWK